MLFTGKIRGNGVRLFVVAAQLGGDLVVRYADAGRNPQFKLDS